MKRGIILLLGFMIFLSSTAFAMDENIAVTSVDSEELSEVINAVYSDEFIDNANILDKSKSENIIMGYKLYYISASDFDYLSNEDSDIEKILPQEYIWLITTGAGVEIRVDLIDNTWHVIGYKSPSENSSDATLAAKDVFVTTQADNSEDFTVFEIPEFSSRFFYYRDAGKDYVIPVAGRSDLTGLVNNEAYSLSEVNDILQTQVSGYALSTEKVYGGGAIDDVDTKAQTNSGYMLYLPIVLVVGGIACRMWLPR